MSRSHGNGHGVGVCACPKHQTRIYQYRQDFLALNGLGPFACGEKKLGCGKPVMFINADIDHVDGDDQNNCYRGRTRSTRCANERTSEQQPRGSSRTCSAAMAGRKIRSMSDTPIFEQLAAELTFSELPGPFYTEDKEPPSDRGMVLENVHGQRIQWSGKRWHEVGDDGSLGTQECWPPYDYGPVLWREVVQ